MSRIGKMPITVPAGVTVTIGADNEVTVKGPNGTLSRKLHSDMIIKSEGSEIVVERPSEEKMHKALHGLTRTLINNMVVGVTTGFTKELEVNGVGYRAAMQGKTLQLSDWSKHSLGWIISVSYCSRIFYRRVTPYASGSTANSIKRWN